MAGRNEFCFKRFTVRQEGCAMKVGTDGVLLGAWCRVDPERDKAILEVGTGTGVIALQLAQRTEMCGAGTVIEAVEVDPEACKAAKQNFEASEWADRLVMHPPMTIQEFAREAEAARGSEKFDHIVSNPPYFVDALESPDLARNRARHAASLTYEELISVCGRLLNHDGRISMIVPAGREASKMIEVAAGVGFAVSRRTEVHSTPKSGPKRTLLEFVRAGGFGGGAGAGCGKGGAGLTAEGGGEKESGLLRPSGLAMTGGAGEEVMQGRDGAGRAGVGGFGGGTEGGEMAIQGGETVIQGSEIVIQGEGKGNFTKEYRDMTREFYLHF